MTYSHFAPALTATLLALLLLGNSHAEVPHATYTKPPCDDVEVPCTCRVDLNEEAVLYARVPFADYQKALVPSLRQANSTHLLGYRTYTIPFAVVWNLTGLGTIFPKTLPPCSPTCPEVPCAPEVVFSKLAVGSQHATFTWKARNITSDLVDQQTVGALRYDLVLPMQLAGRATIQPDLVHLFFDAPYPKLTITDLNYQGGGVPVVIYRERIRCIGSSAQWAVVRQEERLDDLPGLPLYIEPN